MEIFPAMYANRYVVAMFTIAYHLTYLFIYLFLFIYFLNQTVHHITFAKTGAFTAR